MSPPIQSAGCLRASGPLMSRIAHTAASAGSISFDLRLSGIAAAAELGRNRASSRGYRYRSGSDGGRRRVSGLSRGVREPGIPPHDHGAFHDPRAGSGPGHSGVHHRAIHPLLRFGGRDPGRANRGSRAESHQNLLDLLPKTALVRRGAIVQELPIAEVRPGEVVVVRPGAEIPVDGVVVAGHSTVDQSTITGESMPAEKLPGAGVFAGTTNQSGMLEVSTERLGTDTVFGRIIDAVERAEQSRAPSRNLPTAWPRGWCTSPWQRHSSRSC